MTLALILSLMLSQSPEAKQEAKPAAEPAAKPAAKERNLLDVWFEDGLRFKTKDEAFEGRFGGRFLEHYRAMFDRPQESQTGAFPVRALPNTFFVRQARLEFEGTMVKDWGFKVQYDIATGFANQSTGAAASSSSGTLRDAFVDWKHYKEFQIRFGQFLLPLSQEDYTSSRFQDLAERSVMNRMNPSREIGLQFSGNVFDGTLDWYVVLSNGQGTLNDGGRNINDQNDQKEGVLALRWKPFLNGDSSALKHLRLGLSGSYGLVDNISNASFDLISTELSVLYLDSNGAATVLDGSRRRVVPQLSWPIGPFGLRAEYIYRTDDLLDGPGADALRSRGWYTTVSYILTGENKVPETRIVPHGDWGAVELAFRVAQLKMVNAFESGVYLPAGNAEGVSAFSLAVNWWITRNVRFTWEIVREKYSDPVQFDTRNESMMMGTIVRFQIDF